MKTKKRIDDEKNKHPFYSEYGTKLWKKRIKSLELQEKELSKRRKTNNDSILQETTTQEIRES